MIDITLNIFKMKTLQDLCSDESISVTSLISFMEKTMPDKWVFFFNRRDDTYFIVRDSYEELKKEIDDRYDLNYDIRDYYKEVEETHRNYLEELVREEFGKSRVGKAFDRLVDELMLQ